MQLRWLTPTEATIASRLGCGSRLASVEKMCKGMKVSVSDYLLYERNVRLSAPLWLKHPISSRAVKEQALLVDIHKIYDDSKKRGSQSGLGLRSMEVLESLVS